MAEGKGNIIIKDYNVVPESKPYSTTGAPMTNDDPTNIEQGTIGQRIKGKVVYIEGTDGKELGDMDLSIAADVNASEAEEKATEEAQRMAQSAGLDPKTDVKIEKSDDFDEERVGKPKPDQDLPDQPRPDQGLPGGRPGQPGRPDQGLPGGKPEQPPRPDHELPSGKPGRPEDDRPKPKATPYIPPKKK